MRSRSFGGGSACTAHETEHLVAEQVTRRECTVSEPVKGTINVDIVAPPGTHLHPDRGRQPRATKGNPMIAATSAEYTHRSYGGPRAAVAGGDP